MCGSCREKIAGSEPAVLVVKVLFERRSVREFIAGWKNGPGDFGSGEHSRQPQHSRCYRNSL
jgi:hypothetical protein